MAKRIMKAGNTDPPITTTLKEDDGQPVDLTSVITVTLHMKPKGGGIGVISDPCTVTNAIGGVVSYRPTPTETGNPGDYQLEWKTDWGKDAGKDRYRTFPSDDYEELTILPNLEPAP